MWWNKKQEEKQASAKQIVVTEETPPLSAKQFYDKFAKNYGDYGALIEVAFGGGDEMNKEYEKLSDEDREKIVDVAKRYAAKM